MKKEVSHTFHQTIPPSPGNLIKYVVPNFENKCNVPLPAWSSKSAHDDTACGNFMKNVAPSPCLTQAEINDRRNFSMSFLGNPRSVKVWFSENAFTLKFDPLTWRFRKNQSL